MALPKEPRQKMINLMYLVLTALLALNVSAEILNAFKTVNNSLENTNKLVSASTDTYMKSLMDLDTKPESKEKADIWLPKAASAQAIADAAYAKVKKLKDSIMSLSGLDTAKNHNDSYKEDDINTAQRVIVDGGEGKKLHATLMKFKTDILGIDPAIANEFASSFPLDLTPPKSHNKASDTWEGAYFHMTPTIAAVTILTKFQNDIRNGENKVIEFCHKQVGEVVVRFDQTVPIVELSSTYLMNGQELDVTAGVGAFNKQNQPEITIDGHSEATGLDGIVEAKEIANGVGPHSVHIHMTYKDQNGVTQSYDHDYPYTVGNPTGINVSADDVKALYVDLDNHLTVSSGNVGSEKVSVTTDNGRIVRGSTPGQWIVTPVKPGTANINVIADGRPTLFTFKVKSVPDPVAKVGNSKGGRMPVNDFKSQSGIRADLENFIFANLKFTVTSYTIVVTGGKKGFQFRQVVGNSFNPVSDIIEGLGPNTNVTIDEIKANGPGGARDLPPITFNLY